MCLARTRIGTGLECFRKWEDSPAGLGPEPPRDSCTDVQDVTGANSIVHHVLNQALSHIHCQRGRVLQ